MKKRNPSKTYEGLLKQFNALYTLNKNREKENSILSKENEKLTKKTKICR